MFNKFAWFLEYVCGYIDKGLPVDVIYLDFFRKAFDKFPRKINGYGWETWYWRQNMGLDWWLAKW